MENIIHTTNITQMKIKSQIDTEWDDMPYYIIQILSSHPAYIFNSRIMYSDKCYHEILLYDAQY